MEEVGFEDDDESSSWIPLEPNDEDKRVCSRILDSSVHSEHCTQSSQLDVPIHQRTLRRPSSPPMRRSENEKKLHSLQRTLENRQHLRGNLVVHPCSQFPGKFASRLLMEILNLEPHIRVGLSLITIGVLLQVTAILHLFVSKIRCIVLVVLVLVSCAFTYKGGKNAHRILSSMDDPSHLFQAVFSGLENLDSLQLRRIFFVLAVTPSLLEMRAIMFLSHVIIDGGWVTVTTAAASTHAVMSVYSVQSGDPARDCSFRGYVCLYAFALLASLLRVITQKEDLSRISVLAPPFIIAAGSMVLCQTNGEELDWLSHPLRQALRLTLRDVLSELKGDVMEDEMLQLAALRWIADYWGTTAGKSAYDARDCANPATSNEAAYPLVDSDTTDDSNCSVIDSEDMTDWLQITTNQMRKEVNVPRRNHFEQQNKNESPCGLENLCTMLQSMDVDSRAQPAVQAYRSSIGRIPPSRNVAIFIALISRCPSLFSLIIWCLTGSEQRILQLFATLLPLMLVELRRVREWANSCNSSRAMAEVSLTPNRWVPPAELSDTTFIMLCPDRYDPYNPPQLLQVWNNILCSVTALERSLLAARCAQTTCAATELVFAVTELTELGSVICHRGWVYGLRTIAKDILHFIHSGSCYRPAEGTGYAAAAVNAYRSSAVIGKNITHILDDDDGRQLISFAIDIIATSLGRGWIWGVHTHNERRSLADFTPVSPCEELTKEQELHRSLVAIKKSLDPQGHVQHEEGGMPNKSDESEKEHGTEAEKPNELNETGTEQGLGETPCLEEKESDMSWDEILTKRADGEDPSSEKFAPECAPMDGEDEQVLVAPDQTLHSDNGDDWVKWAGGGLALVATIVGGIVLANAAGTNSRNDEMCDHQKKESSSNSSQNE